MEKLEPETIPYLINKVHANARAKGWWDTERQPLELLMLVVTELSEAAEELRHAENLGFNTIYFNKSHDNKPEGFPIEIADAVIRIFDLCGGYNIDLSAAIEQKIEYNLTRQYRHGNKRY